MTEAQDPQYSHKEIDGRLDLRVLPLTMCLYMVIIGVVVSWITAWIFPVEIGQSWGALGLALLIGSWFNTKWCFRHFRAAGTNTNTTKPALKIVRSGPYRFSRNPMYLSYVAGYLGISLLANSWPMLILTPLFGFWITQWIILPEESYLEKYFGQDYLDYKRSSRRWL